MKCVFYGSALFLYEQISQSLVIQSIKLHHFFVLSYNIFCFGSLSEQGNKDNLDFWIRYWLLPYHDICPYSSYDIRISSSINYIKMGDRYHSLVHEKQNKNEKLQNVHWQIISPGIFSPPWSTVFKKTTIFRIIKEICHQFFHLYCKYMQ